MSPKYLKPANFLFAGLAGANTTFIFFLQPHDNLSGVVA